MNKLFNGIYHNRRILVTGHTGFKGSWLVFWLRQMGAIVSGYSLPPNTTPNHHDLLSTMEHLPFGDINDSQKLTRFFEEAQPEIVFHLAAQPLVRASYSNPSETYKTNVMGTLNVCEAVRCTPSVKALVAITTDKVYDNKEWTLPYCEDDRLGGYDPYSSSKACAEILLSSYRNSYFNTDRFAIDHYTLIASARGGNVIGGGDWSNDRLIPDLMRSCADNCMVPIRNPQATRPWQHVLDCLSGYLTLGKALLEKDITAATAFNFGPSENNSLSVRDVISRIASHWPSLRYEFFPNQSPLHEANYLKLDCSRAHSRLNWKPVWNVNQAFSATALWYRSYYENKLLQTSKDLEQYINDAQQQNASWSL